MTGNADHRPHVRELDLVDLAERVQVISRQAQRRRLRCGIGIGQIEDLLVRALEIIDPAQVPSGPASAGLGPV